MLKLSFRLLVAATDLEEESENPPDSETLSPVFIKMLIGWRPLGLLKWMKENPHGAGGADERDGSDEDVAAVGG